MAAYIDKSYQMSGTILSTLHVVSYLVITKSYVRCCNSYTLCKLNSGGLRILIHCIASKVVEQVLF